MTPALRLTLERDIDATCGLHCEADHDGFAGRGSAWFSLDQVRRFCDALDAYPMAPQGVALAGGCGTAPGGTAPDVVTMSLTVRPTDRVGGLELMATLAEPPVTNLPATKLRGATVSIPVTYHSLHGFNATLRALLDGRALEAVLDPPAAP